MSKKNETLSQGLAENRIKHELPLFLKSLSEILEETFDKGAVASWHDTTILRECFLDGVNAPSFKQRIPREPHQSRVDAIYQRFFKQKEKTEVFEIINRLSSKLGGEKGYLLISIDNDPIAVLVDVSTILKRAQAIIELDGDSLSILSKDRQQGLLIDYNADDEEQNYEFAFWGNDWSSVIEACV